MNQTLLYSDFEIIQKVLTGEPELYEILLRRHNSYLYKTGRCYGFSHEDTQDLMQDTFLDAFSHLSRFENRSSFKTWLIKIMLNNCFRKRQKMSFKNEIPGEISENSSPVYSGTQGTDTARTVLNRELHHILEDALQKIPFDYRMVFSLRAMSGLSVREAAGILNISEVNVKVRLNRAKAMLRKEVEKSYSAEDIYEFNLVYCDAIAGSVMKKIKYQKNGTGNKDF